MSDQPLKGKTAVVFGVANKRSIAWAIAKAWAEAGATLIFNYQGERLKDNLSQLTGTFGVDTLYIVSPYEDQRRLVTEILEHWLSGHGSRYNSKRGDALGLVRLLLVVSG